MMAASTRRVLMPFLLPDPFFTFPLASFPRSSDATEPRSFPDRAFLILVFLPPRSTPQTFKGLLAASRSWPPIEGDDTFPLENFR